MPSVVWPDAVLDQIDQIVAYIELFNPRAAQQMGQRLFDPGESLATLPERGRPAARGTRELVAVPPYILRFEIVKQEVVILDIRHSARASQD